MDDLDLLRMEMDLLWGLDPLTHSIRPHPLVAIATASEGRETRFAPKVSNEFRSQWETLVALGDPNGWERVGASLTPHPFSPLRIEGGPSFLMRGDEVAPPAPFRILDSNASGLSPTNVRRPEVWGDDAEWEELLKGRLGPWALALSEDRVVGVCYTPAASHDAAEAGVWTDAVERGRGCAPLVTAAWGNVARQRFGTLFYSAGFANSVSQAVARKLGLRPLGTIRHLWPTD